MNNSKFIINRKRISVRTHVKLYYQDIFKILMYGRYNMHLYRNSDGKIYSIKNSLFTKYFKRLK